MTQLISPLFIRSYIIREVFLCCVLALAMTEILEAGLHPLQ